MNEDDARVERVARAIGSAVADQGDFSFGYHLAHKAARAAIAAATAWQPIETAPRDGTKIDLLFPYPRGRQKDCQWRKGGIYGDGDWFWLIPRWGSQPRREWDLLPEDEWDTGSYPNTQPTHWMPLPEPPR